MKKIPTIFVRDFANGGRITQEWNPDCLWVRDGLGRVTRKWDGTSCLWSGGMLWKRREYRTGDYRPPTLLLADNDEQTGKVIGWLPVGDGPDDRWHREGLIHVDEPLKDGWTYELCGPKVNGNKDKFDRHVLIEHGLTWFHNTPQTYDSIKRMVESHDYEGFVWHAGDGRMAKIKRRDFGLRW